MNNAETEFNRIVKEFEEKVGVAAKIAIDKIHSDMLPYVNTDAENNAIFRANDIVGAILNGNFESTEDGRIVVFGWTIARIDDFDYNKLVDALASRCADKAVQAKIERLERKLKEAWGTY